MAPRLFPTDEELGKRDDDYAPRSQTTQPWRSMPHSYRRRRRVGIVLGLVVVACLLIYVLSTPGPENAVYDAADPSKQLMKLGGPPPAVAVDTDEAARRHYYNGHIKFFELPNSLHSIGHTGGLRDRNRNVLFAASNLKSVSVLIPLACEMAKWDRNHVHFAVMGRHDVGLDDLLEVNGIDRDGCNVYWHDARPDYVTYSSDPRAEAGVITALGHMHTFIHPQVMIIDDHDREDGFFVRGLGKESLNRHFPVIQIPRNRADALEWLTRLDSDSLRAWHTPSVEILIHAPPRSSGSLLRLLKSIRDADYTGLNRPRITIELPPDIDPPSMSFLSHIVWPPSPMDPFLTSRQNGLVLRHRIPDQAMSSDEAAMRVLESFYPSFGSHVLLLAPNAQLSPLYYHYLMYHLLEYRYSSHAADNNHLLVGLCLEVPPYHLNGTTSFEPPTTVAMRADRYKAAHHNAAQIPFTWQAPNSNAALYFGDKWAEVHSFLRNRISIFRRQQKPLPRPRTVHESLPTWLEYLLELMRARGYAMHYPGLGQEAQALVTVHSELHQPPEEILSALAKQDHDAATVSSSDGDPQAEPPASPFLAGDSDAALALPLYAEAMPMPGILPLHQLLPFDADLPPLSALPELSHQGVPRSNDREVAEAALEVAQKFRETIGGCAPEPKGMRRVVVESSARDLFCFGDEGSEAFERIGDEEATEAPK